MNKIEAGTKIIITTPDAGESYKKGDIFEVTRVSASGTGVHVAHEGRECYYVSGREFEVYTEPEKAQPTKIKVLKSNYPREYEVGDVLEVQSGPDAVGAIYVTNKHGNDSCVFEGHWEEYTEPLAEWEKELLNVFPRKIEFADIQEGDLIKAEYMKGDVKNSVEGFAAQNKYGGWVSKSGIWVADPHYETPVYTLLERPEPPKPNPFAEANVGSLARESDDYVWLKTADNKWQFFRKVKNYIGELSDSSLTDTEMNQGRHHITHNA